jgi:phosphate transport system protein
MARDNLLLHIHQVQDELLLMGSMVEQATMRSVQALKKKDIESAKVIYNEDNLINEKRYAIENSVLILIATQQPLAHDLRLMAALLEIAAEIERMGDYAKGIAKVVVKLGDYDFPMPLKEIEQMASLAIDMFHRALSAFIAEDPLAARKIPSEDDAIDVLYQKVQKDVVEVMIKHPEMIDNVNLFMWVAHNLERMADRVSNICERTVFVATGELGELEVEKKRLD